MNKLQLILSFHNHQPVGNFDHVLEDCYRKAYLPFLELLLDHPRFRCVLHYSGDLLLWMQKQHPESIDMIRTLVHEDRVELLSGGIYEPILSVLPEKDRVMQIAELSGFIKKHIGYAPKGMWLAERVWEPQMPRFIARAGIEYLPIDDYHFKLTGLEDGDLLGYYTTEDEGHTVSIFPGSEKLRYLIPFRGIDEILSYFREVSMRGGSPLLTMADDGEKFGVWPKTYKHCYEDRWLDNFITAIEENSDWIETTTFKDYHAKFPPVGRVYLPTASYREMGEWALPSEAGLEYEFVLEQLGKVVGEKSKGLLRGSIWRSFMVKYPEANHMHKRMCMISRKVHSAYDKDARKGRGALTELWKGQCNDAYWHGIFGGLYLPHLRSALYRHLLKAEALAGDILKKRQVVEHADFDCDGFKDIVLDTKELTLVATEKGGSLTELSLKKQAVNLFDIISRRPEAYHAKIAKASDTAAEGTKTIHDQISVKEEGLVEYLVYDGYRRSSLLDHFFPHGTTLQDVRRSEQEELGDFIGGPYTMKKETQGKDFILGFSRLGRAGQNRMKIDKTVTVSEQHGLKIDYRLDGIFSGLFAVEMNMSLLGSPHSRIRAGGMTTEIRSSSVQDDIRRFSLGDSYLDLNVDYAFGQNISLWHYPVETISLSEQGIERLYQGTSFLFVYPVELMGKKKLGFTISFGGVKK
ncbi:MAG: DUF1926 domain-containing protein [Nitrospirae bacterium]|nr:DUF1926 domain-containing protein [Nitrospirota bacterium]